MTCIYSINNLNFETEEAELVGLLCSIIDNNILCDVNISSADTILIPHYAEKSWSLHYKFDSIRILHNVLQMNPNTNVEPIVVNKSKYYIPFDMKDGFIIGYSRLLFIIKNKQMLHFTNYITYWEPDISFLHNTRFVSSPYDNLVNNRNYKVNVPYYLWDILIDQPTYVEQLVSNFVNLFLSRCTIQDYCLLMNGNHYLRFMTYKDHTTYVYAYLRSIDNCAFESHKMILKEVTCNMLPCEIIIDKRGYFFTFPTTEWLNKKVTHFTQIY